MPSYEIDPTESVQKGDLPGNLQSVMEGVDPNALRAVGAFVPDFPMLNPLSNFTRFAPPHANDTPSSLFTADLAKSSFPAPCFTRISNSEELLIYTAGSCLDNGKDSARAGCAFVFRPEINIETIPPTTAHGQPISYLSLYTLGVEKFRLETRGSNGNVEPQTSNRAELRAIIGVLQFCMWHDEGYSRLVIASDSSYVVDGATSGMRKWQMNGWKTASRKAVKNRDMWELVIQECDRWSKCGLNVEFWLIPKEQNKLAHKFAKEAAALPASENTTARSGVLV
jgi:ribonuclease HI